jgi:hypothetical protein
VVAATGKGNDVVNVILYWIVNHPGISLVPRYDLSLDTQRNVTLSPGARQVIQSRDTRCHQVAVRNTKLQTDNHYKNHEHYCPNNRIRPPPQLTPNRVEKTQHGNQREENTRRNHRVLRDGADHEGILPGQRRQDTVVKS